MMLISDDNSWFMPTDFFSVLHNLYKYITVIIVCISLCILQFLSKKKYQIYKFTLIALNYHLIHLQYIFLGHRDCMIVGFTTTYTISAYHHKSCEFEPH